MRKLCHNGWTGAVTLAVLLLCVYVYSDRKRDTALLQKFNDLQKEQDELVLRLAPVLPGGPYVQEPKPFNEEAFKEDISDKIQ